jgi:hypothetical protein
MSKIRTTIDHIVRKKSIVEYLAKRGIEPLKTLSGGRYLYYCPIPDHAESKPSFYVWTQAEYENYYCFGCRSNHNIIHLAAALDGIPFRDALNKLSEGLKFTHEDDVELDKLRGNKEWEVDRVIFPFADMLISISHRCYTYLRGVEFDPVEVTIIDQLYARIDGYLASGEVHEIEEVYHTLNKVLKIRKQKHKEACRERRKDMLRYSAPAGKGLDQVPPN